MRGKNDEQIAEAATRLLANRERHRTEGNVQSDIEALLRALGVGTIESHYQIGSEQADIYLPNRRAFIECKAYPKAADPDKPQSRKKPETPREQLDRYVHAQIEYEASTVFSAAGQNAGWLGIVTDGSNWHIYRYPNEAAAEGDPVEHAHFLTEADALATLLANQLGADMVGKEWIPEKPGDLFSDLKDRLDLLHAQLPPSVAETTATKHKLWLDMMETSGMVPADDAGKDRLFLAHSFLIAVVRLVSHSLKPLRGRSASESAIKDGFASWVLDFERGRRWISDLWELVDNYDWQSRRSDVLRDLYHSYVDPEDRKVFGEFYTPDWLAALMVQEVLDDAWIEKAAAAAQAGWLDGMGVLDPACGSGTFLYHAALRILDHRAVRSLARVRQADIVARLVNGMDIHPVAVEIARVNIERALPSEPSDGASAFQVYLGDSLQAASRGDLLFGHTADAMRLNTPQGRQVHVPISLVRSATFAESMRRMVNAAVAGEPLPSGIAVDDRPALEACHRELTKVVEAEGNSVWTWYAVNLAGPYLLAQRKIDRIVANPPWVKLADIQVEDRKRAMEELGRSLGLQAGGKQAPHLDIASFFVLRTRELYAGDPDRDPGSWLVKRSAIRSGQWALFRRVHNTALAQFVDLKDLNPFNGGDATRCCLLMEHRAVGGVETGRTIEARRVARHRPQPHESLSVARARFELVAGAEPPPQAASDYEGTGFRQGATILPHVLGWVAAGRKAAQPGWTQIDTLRSKHDPWKGVPSQSGLVPEGWVRPLHTSPDLLPYMASRKPAHAIIPVELQAEVGFDPGSVSRFWRELDEVYETYKGRGGNTPETLRARFDFAGNLSAQPSEPQRGRRMVLYPKSADIMRAARTQAGVAVVNDTLYWLTARNEAEAGYLVALLNAKCLQRAFAESKESGRDFHLHPWRKVPIPRYDRGVGSHRRLAELCAASERIADSAVAAEVEKRPSLGQPGLSKVVREAVAGSAPGQEIERIAAALLPNQADSPA